MRRTIRPMVGLEKVSTRTCNLRNQERCIFPTIVNRPAEKKFNCIGLRC